MGKKERNRLQEKKNNHLPPDAEIAKEIAHGKEKNPDRRKKHPKSK
ncbi:hypothetical protein [Bacillus marinisedimentorum]|nr:hypothetical protein [Bacillus marinisedimentorum]